MSTPGQSGHRSGGVTKYAASQPASRKTGSRLTWILPSPAPRAGSPPPPRPQWRNRNSSRDLRYLPSGTYCSTWGNVETPAQEQLSHPSTGRTTRRPAPPLMHQRSGDKRHLANEVDARMS